MQLGSLFFFVFLCSPLGLAFPPPSFLLSFPLTAFFFGGFFEIKTAFFFT